MTDDLAMMSATELVAHYRRKTLSPVEVTQAALERIEQCDGALNAFCHQVIVFFLFEIRELTTHHHLSTSDLTYYYLHGP